MCVPRRAFHVMAVDAVARYDADFSIPGSGASNRHYDADFAGDPNHYDADFSAVGKGAVAQQAGAYDLGAPDCELTPHPANGQGIDFELDGPDSDVDL